MTALGRSGLVLSDLLVLATTWATLRRRHAFAAPAVLRSRLARVLLLDGASLTCHPRAVRDGGINDLTVALTLSATVTVDVDVDDIVVIACGLRPRPRLYLPN